MMLKLIKNEITGRNARAIIVFVIFTAVLISIWSSVELILAPWEVIRPGEHVAPKYSALALLLAGMSTLAVAILALGRGRGTIAFLSLGLVLAISFSASVLGGLIFSCPWLWRASDPNGIILLFRATGFLIGGLSSLFTIVGCTVIPALADLPSSRGR